MWAALIHDVTVIYVLVPNLSIHLPWKWLKDLSDVYILYTFELPASVSLLPIDTGLSPTVSFLAIDAGESPTRVVTVLVTGLVSLCLVQPHADIKFLPMSAPQLLNIAAYFTYEMKRKSPVNATTNMKPFFGRHDEGLAIRLSRHRWAVPHQYSVRKRIC